jgi:hypothetical protein
MPVPDLCEPINRVLLDGSEQGWADYFRASYPPLDEKLRAKGIARTRAAFDEAFTEFKKLRS